MNCTVRSGDCEFSVAAQTTAISSGGVHIHGTTATTTHVACRWCLIIQPLPWPKAEPSQMLQPQMPIGSHR